MSAQEDQAKTDPEANEAAAPEPAEADSKADAPKADNDDIRAKMREALDKKHEHERAGEAHLDGHGKASSTHGKSGGAREYRRKSGPGGA